MNEIQEKHNVKKEQPELPSIFFSENSCEMLDKPISEVFLKHRITFHFMNPGNIRQIVTLFDHIFAISFTKN